jgi:hypothetical protein
VLPVHLPEAIAMIVDREFKEKVTVRFYRRDDGGLRARCDEIPGFYLSGTIRDVLDDVVPAIEALMDHNLGIQVHVFPLKHGQYQMIEKTNSFYEQADEQIPKERDYLVERVKAA